MAVASEEEGTEGKPGVVQKYYILIILFRALKMKPTVKHLLNPKCSMYSYFEDMFTNLK